MKKILIMCMSIILIIMAILLFKEANMNTNMYESSEGITVATIQKPTKEPTLAPTATPDAKIVEECDPSKLGFDLAGSKTLILETPYTYGTIIVNGIEKGESYANSNNSLMFYMGGVFDYNKKQDVLIMLYNDKNELSQQISITNFYYFSDVTMNEISTHSDANYILTTNEITGDIKDLNKLHDLKYLCFSACKDITGDTSVFSELNNLVTLEFYYCPQLEGDINSFSNLSNLRKLHIDTEGIGGNLSSLADIEKLEKLMLSNDEIVGTISDLCNIKNLRDLNLDLNSDNISGNIEGLNELKDMNRLVLSGNEIRGNISKLDYGTLSRIAIYGCPNLFGDLSGVDLANLKEFRLKNCNEIVVDISYFYESSELEILEIQMCDKFTGNLSDIEGLLHLKELILWSDSITGNVIKLSRLENLEKLLLAGSNYLNGDITKLAALSNLKECYVRDCPNIEGELELIINNISDD